MSNIIKVRAHITQHMHVAVFDFYVAPHMWDIDDLFRIAAYNGNLGVVKYLVSVGADVHKYYDYALRSSAQNGFLDVVKYLVSVGADVHALDDDVICGAAAYGRLETVKYLVSAGAIGGANVDVLYYAIYLANKYAKPGYMNVVNYLNSIKERA